MVEVTLLCERCNQEFVRTATTDEEIKELQRTIWNITVCNTCAQQDNYYCE